MQQAKTRVKLPASMGKNAEDVKPDPDDVLNYIPGFCFTDLLDSLSQPARPGIVKICLSVSYNSHFGSQHENVLVLDMSELSIADKNQSFILVIPL